MNVQETKSYLEELLPGFTITVHERYQNKPNNRFEFTRDGVDAAMLFAQKLNITKEFLQDVAAAVRKRFDSPEAIEKKLDAEEKKTTAPVQKTAPEPQPQVNEFAGSPSELEFSFYKAAKQLVADFEAKYPMT